MYDALNVFIALGIITKEKKDIKWKGRPTGAHQEVVTLERDKKILEESIAQKQKELDELCAQVRKCFSSKVFFNELFF